MFEKTAIKKEIMSCSTCGGRIPNGCSCYGGFRRQNFETDEWEWKEQEQEVWEGKHDPNVKVRFPDEQ